LEALLTVHVYVRLPGRREEGDQEESALESAASLDELNENASKMWIPGKWLSIDEQTLGFQGRCGLKLRIYYKKKGDGFQCDAVCDDGYTFAFYFRHGDPPPLPNEFKEKLPDLSPTAMRVVWLALQLPNMWSRIYMDNLFNSQKLFTALYLAKALDHRSWPPTLGEATRGEEREGGAEGEGMYGCSETGEFVGLFGPLCDLVA
jgi:hypothetical protein